MRFQMMKIKAAFATLVGTGLCAAFSFDYYVPSNKRIKKLLKKHPKASYDLWVDAFDSGMDYQRSILLREEDDKV